jgi:predicted cupin superfamily sugar epimerase
VNAASIISELQLQPHPEGGWYREVYRSPTRSETSRGPRSALTTIYYLLEQNQLSRWHVVQADELWHHYGGAALELFSFHPATRKLVRHVVGPVSPEGGAAPVAVIPAGVWQAARSLGSHSLVGCSVGPGFDFADFQFVCDVPAHADHFRGELAPLADLL